jgi:hypothetical protein
MGADTLVLESKMARNHVLSDRAFDAPLAA